MKKYLYIFITALIAITTLSLVSCSKDDDESNISKSALVGTWKNTDTDIMGTIGYQYIQFKSNGDLVEVDIDNGEMTGNPEVDVKYGKWVLKDNHITVSGRDFTTSTATILKLTKSKLVLSLILTMTYKKVSDSEIEKYLK